MPNLNQFSEVPAESPFRPEITITAVEFYPADKWELFPATSVECENTVTVAPKRDKCAQWERWARKMAFARQLAEETVGLIPASCMMDIRQGGDNE